MQKVIEGHGDMTTFLKNNNLKAAKEGVGGLY